MLLEVKRYTVPHLKALTCIIEHTSGQGDGSAFKEHYHWLALLSISIA